MEKRNFILIIFLALSLMFTSFSVSFADPSQLIVVRASDNSLWKSTCEGTTCTSFTSFPGQFTSQPAVIWDEDLQRFVLWGRGGDGAVWRSTFTRLGVFNNDWTVPIPGSTPSPPGAAGGGIFSNFVSTNGSMSPVPLSTTIANITSLTGVDAPFGGFIVVTATGTVEHARSATGANAFSRIYIATASGGTSSAWIFTDLPSAAPTGTTSFPFATSRWFSVAAGTNHAYYLTGEAGGANTTTGVYNATMTTVFYPYSF